MNSKVVAVIPARGGSKGIPHKNLKLLDGIPLIAHSILAAKKARLVNRVIVSTDDAEIANVAKSFGAEVIKRPDEISGDFSSSEAALFHVLDELKQKENYVPDELVFLQCTSPLTISQDINGALDTYYLKKADSLLSVSEFHFFVWNENENEEMVGINHDHNRRLLRQGLKPQYLETGSIYIMNVNGFYKNKFRFFGKIAKYVIPPERRWEIDDPIDLEIAEFLIKKREKFSE